MFRQMFILNSGKKIMVTRGWKKRTYRPGNMSLRRCVRLLIVYMDRRFKTGRTLRYHVSSTTGGWEKFDISLTSAPVPAVELTSQEEVSSPLE